MPAPRAPWAKQRAALVALSRGATIKEAAVISGLGSRTVDSLVREHGRMTICERTPRANALTQSERETIFIGVREGHTAACIARALGRHRSTVSREITANGGCKKYRPFMAQDRADRASRRQRPRWWLTNPELWDLVYVLLKSKWSPQQISGWLRRNLGDDPNWCVSHESIYQAIYIQGLPELRKELTKSLRTGRLKRRVQGRSGCGSPIKNMVNLSERPAEVEDRAVPGHWEGDLIIGLRQGSAIATLVERSTGFGMLIKLDSKNAIHVGEQIAKHMGTLDHQIRLSLTWDQGTEMADHLNFTERTAIPVYFCDPGAPWQRGTNENWNGLVRQYLPKGTDLSVHSQQRLNEIAAELNDRPRARYDFQKPSDLFNQLVAATP